MKNILVVDDDATIGEMLVEYLSQHDFAIDVVGDHIGFKRYLSDKTPDLLLVDMNLGEEDGMEIVREITDQLDAPVIIMSGRRLSESDRVLGLELGARDYVAKPFNLREMLARIRGALKHRSIRGASAGRSYVFNGWRLSTRHRRLTSAAGMEVKLTASELNILIALVESPKRVMSREKILLATRIYDQEVFDRSIDVLILRLRRKLEKFGLAKHMIVTKRGLGYVFDADVEIAQNARVLQ